jgi:ribonuclease D
MSAPSPPGEILLIDDEDALPDALAGMDVDVVGVDVERADAQRYYRRAALVQVGVADRCLLVDPLAIPDLGALDRFLAGRTAVLHAVENDLEPLEATGVRPGRIADTAIAAALLGRPTGLGPLLAEVLEVVLTPDKERYQRADWEARPLTDGMAEYAAGDVFHLPELWTRLADELDRAGRTSWYEQELQATIARAEEDRRDWTRTKGSGRLSPRARAILRSLWQEREAISRQHDIAPNRLLREQTLVEVAADPATSPDELVRRNQRRRGPLREHADRLFAAIQRGTEAEPEARESSGRRWSDVDKESYDALRKVRARRARELGLDPGVLCPSRPLWAAVAGEPASADELATLAGLRPWQAELLAEQLWETYTDVRARHAANDDA